LKFIASRTSRRPSLRGTKCELDLLANRSVRTIDINEDRAKLERAAAEIDNRFASNALIATKVFVDLSLEVRNSFDDEQFSVLQISQDCLAGTATEHDRLRALEVVCRRINGDFNWKSTSLESAHRLLFASLVRNDGFSSDAADLAIDEAIHAGVTPQRIAEIFNRHVPGFENPFH
jgi:hypothetical protein